MLFKDTKAPLRTDEEYRNMQDDTGHKKLSPLTRLRNFNFDTKCPTEPMHLIANVVKRLLRHVYDKKSLIEGKTLEDLDASTRSASAQLPLSCFQRRIYDMKDSDRWKATQCRQFIIYLAPIVLFGIVRPAVYNLVIRLSLGLIILSTPGICVSNHMNKRAGQLLLSFVDSWTADFFLADDTVRCIHALTHIHNDVKIHGGLDSYAAYDFEDSLRYLAGGNVSPGHIVTSILRNADVRLKNGFGVFTSREEDEICMGINREPKRPPQKFRYNNEVYRTTGTDRFVLIRGHPAVLSSCTQHSFTFRCYKYPTRFINTPDIARSVQGIYLLADLTLGGEKTALPSDITGKGALLPTPTGAHVFTTILHTHTPTMA